MKLTRRSVWNYWAIDLSRDNGFFSTSSVLDENLILIKLLWYIVFPENLRLKAFSVSFYSWFNSYFFTVKPLLNDILSSSTSFLFRFHRNLLFMKKKLKIEISQKPWSLNVDQIFGKTFFSKSQKVYSRYEFCETKIIPVKV